MLTCEQITEQVLSVGTPTRENWKQIARAIHPDDPPLVIPSDPALVDRIPLIAEEEEYMRAFTIPGWLGLTVWSIARRQWVVATNPIIEKLNAE